MSRPMEAWSACSVPIIAASGKGGGADAGAANAGTGNCGPSPMEPRAPLPSTRSKKSP